MSPRQARGEDLIPTATWFLSRRFPVRNGDGASTVQRQLRNLAVFYNAISKRTEIFAPPRFEKKIPMSPRMQRSSPSHEKDSLSIIIRSRARKTDLKRLKRDHWNRKNTTQTQQFWSPVGSSRRRPCVPVFLSIPRINTGPRSSLSSETAHGSPDSHGREVFRT